MSVRVINDEAHFQSELAGAVNKLVIVDFTASWLVKMQFFNKVMCVIILLNPGVALVNELHQYSNNYRLNIQMRCSLKSMSISVKTLPQPKAYQPCLRLYFIVIECVSTQ